MKKAKLPEELGTEFSIPQIVSISKQAESLNLPEERTFCDCFFNDCGCHEHCNCDCSHDGESY